MKKRMLALLLVMGLVSATVPAYAAETISVDRNKIQVVVDGQKVEADNFLYKGTTYIPLRAVSENMGGQVDYQAENQTATITSAPTSTTGNTIQTVPITDVHKTALLFGMQEAIYSSLMLYDLYTPEYFSTLSYQDQEQAMLYFDECVGQAAYLYNTTYEAEYEDLYETAEYLQDVALALNKLGTDLTKLEFENDKTIYSTYTDSYLKVLEIAASFSTASGTLINNMLGTDYAI